MTARPSVSAGFTLVEMLVALSIFAMLSAMGVALLRSSVTTQDAVQRELERGSDLVRARALLAQDLAQALPRPSRDAGGGVRPAFIGTDRSIAFVHGGGDRSPLATRPAVQRVTYALDGSDWRRGVDTALDGGTAEKGDVLIADVSRIALRYRDAKGGWQSGWGTDAALDILPRAAEITIERRGHAPMTLAFLVAPTPVTAEPVP